MHDWSKIRVKSGHGLCGDSSDAAAVWNLSGAEVSQTEVHGQTLGNPKLKQQANI